MDRRAGVVAARVGGVMAVESLVRSRTRPALWGTALLGLVGIVAGIAAGGLAGGLLIVLGVVLLLAWGTALAMRAGALFTLRRAGGGSEYELVRPVIARHYEEVARVRSSPALARAGLGGLLRIARRPAEVEAMVREAGAAICRRVPALVDEVDAVLRQG